MKTRIHWNIVKQWNITKSEAYAYFQFSSVCHWARLVFCKAFSRFSAQVIILTYVDVFFVVAACWRRGNTRREITSSATGKAATRVGKELFWEYPVSPGTPAARLVWNAPAGIDCVDRIIRKGIKSHLACGRGQLLCHGSGLLASE